MRVPFSAQISGHRRIWLFAFCAALISLSNVSTGSAQTSALDEGDRLFAMNDIDGARASYEQVLNSDSDNVTALYNIGQCAYLTNDFQSAKNAWQKVDLLSGTADLRVKEKLIQTMEKLGERADVEAAILELESMHASTTDEQYRVKPSFCRDQFTIGTRKFIAHHHFGFPGNTDKIYTIYCIGESGSPEFYFELASPETTTTVAREQGDIAADERIYSVDEYHADGTTSAHALYKEILDYAQLKQAMSEVLEERDGAAEVSGNGR